MSEDTSCVSRRLSECDWSDRIRYVDTLAPEDEAALREGALSYVQLREDASESRPETVPFFKLYGEHSSRGYLTASSENAQETQDAIEQFDRILLKYADNELFREAGLAP